MSMDDKISVVRGGANYWLLRRKVYSPHFRAWSELAEVNYPSKAMATAAGKAWLREKRQQNPSGIRAQVRRLASGQIQLKIPLKRGENALRKAQEVAKALGRKVVSVARAGGRAQKNPESAYKAQVEVISSSGGPSAVKWTGHATLAQAKKYVGQLRSRGLLYGRTVIIRDLGTMRVVYEKMY